MTCILRRQYDQNIKELLADIQVLARIIKYTVREVKELEDEDDSRTGTEVKSDV